MSRRRSLGALLGASLLGTLAAGVPGVAHALSLVEGRYVSDGMNAAEPDPTDGAAGSGVERFKSDRFILMFTPRDPLVSQLRDDSGDDDRSNLPSLRISMATGGAESDRLTLMGAGTMPVLGLSPDMTTPTTQTLAIGGAVELNDWALGATYLQSSGMGEEAEMTGATLGYGRLTTRLAIGEQSSIQQGGDRQFYLFSTDLAARPWLNLEGDLGFTPAQETNDSSTVGRVGVRLKF